MHVKMTSNRLLLVMILSLALAIILPAFAHADDAADYGEEMTAQAAPHTQAEAVAYARSLIGQWINYDGAGEGADCVDIAEAYYVYLGQPMPTGNAYAYASGNKPPTWTRVYSNPQPGDVATWAASSANYGWGHVAVVVGVSGSTISVVEQDSSKNVAAYEKPYPASSPSSYLRPDWPDNNNPVGSLDAAVGADGTVHVTGWALDRDNPSAQIEVHVYVGGSSATGEGHGKIIANLPRADVNSALGVPGNHGFDATLSTGKRGEVEVYAYGINIGGGENAQLDNVRTATILEPKKNAVSVPEGSYAIRTKLDASLGVDIDGASSDNGANAQLHRWNGTSAQVFQFVPAGDGSYYIVAACSDKALEVTNGSVGNNANVAQHEQNQTPAQRWWLDENADGTYTLRNRKSGLVMDVAGAKADSGTNIQQFTANGGDNQRFYLVPTDASKWSVRLSASQFDYTGSAHKPTPTVSAGGVTLSQGTDYTVSYANNTDAGLAAASIKGIGGFVGVKEATFAISPAQITSVSAADQKYTGRALEPTPTVKAGSLTVPASGYTATYSNNVKAGTATVKVAGKGNFAGTKSATFEITGGPSGAEPGGASATYTVRFTDGQGRALKTQKVEAGKAATAPVAPTRSGYVFDGWDKPFGKVTSDLTVNAKWKAVSSAPKVAWTRLAGDNAFKTMSKVIDAGGFAKGGTVVLASLEGYWDALTAAGIAGLEEAPVVMATPDGLSPEATAQLKALAPERIVVCGGTYWLPQGVLDAAKAAAGTGPAIVRLAGDNAAATAEKIAAAGKGKWSGTAIVATAGTFQDALAAAPISWAKHMPIFLAQFDSGREQGYITQATIKAMKDAGITRCYIAGGSYWIPKKVEDDLKAAKITVVKRLGGETAVETSGLIAQEAVSELGMRAEKMGVANVAQHYDALASASFCGKANSVLVLVRDDKSSVINGFVKSSAPGMTKGYVFGGTGSVSAASMKALEAATK